MSAAAVREPAFPRLFVGGPVGGRVLEVSDQALGVMVSAYSTTAQLAAQPRAPRMVPYPVVVYRAWRVELPNGSSAVVYVAEGTSPDPAAVARQLEAEGLALG